MIKPLHCFRLALVILFTSLPLFGVVEVSPIFTDHMVLQRGKPVPIWGTAAAGEAIRVTLAGQEHQSRAGEDGRWRVDLSPMEAGGPHELVVSGSNEVRVTDVLVGEVWLASGQSNMEWKMSRALDFDLQQAIAADASQIRFIPVKNPGAQEPAAGVKGAWQVATPETLADASAVAYHFARVLHAALGVPVGIIENAWGGSSAEAWVDREVIRSREGLRSIHETWLEIESDYDFAEEVRKWEEKVRQWEAARDAGEAKGNRPNKPQNRMVGQHRPGNLWNARVLPVVPYAIRGVIWYQGESNSSRWNQYRELFGTLIQEWRAAWGEEFPFYWAQLADFRTEAVFSETDTWPYLREAQTLVMEDLPQTGQAVLIDVGEGKDIHPRDKLTVGRRLARWALHKDYGFGSVFHRSPQLRAWRQEGDRVILEFAHTGTGLRALETNELVGFVVQRGGQWSTVSGRISEVDQVTLQLQGTEPVEAVRYAWADNPPCNLFSMEGLPVTPFRTDVD
jgi:sialate O-acetylesterase